jgi:hypothetical protein
MTDGHYPSYREMLEKVNWESYGVVDGVARDPRCENCMVHCGYDPSGALSTKPRDTWLNMKYNFGRRPAMIAPSPLLEAKAFNGVSIGKGHLAEAKAAVNREMSGAKSAFARGGNDLPATEPAAGGGCSSGDTSERDALLAKIRDSKSVQP